MSTTLCNPFSDVAVSERPEIVPDNKATPAAKWDCKSAIEACFRRLGFSYSRSISLGGGHNQTTDHWGDLRTIHVGGEINRWDDGCDCNAAMRVRVASPCGSEIHVFGFPRNEQDISILEATAVAMINAASNAAIP